MAMPFTSPAALSSPPSARTNGYYSVQVNSNARNGGTGRAPAPPLSSTRRVVNTPARNGERARISYTGASAGAEFRELYRNPESSPRRDVLSLREPVRGNAAETGVPAALSVGRNLTDRGDFINQRYGETKDTGREDAVRRDAGEWTGNPVNDVDGGAGDASASSGSFLAALALLPPLSGDTGEGVPVRGEGRHGAGERDLLNPLLKPWSYERKVKAKRRLKL
jgi:hypothetical protein